jgi:hypothetical protein
VVAFGMKKTKSSKNCSWIESFFCKGLLYWKKK